MIVGVDGYKRGWIAAIDGPDGDTRIEVFATFSDIAKRAGFKLVVIDVPIGLPDLGPRCADVEARRLLKRRGCCVFPAPIRPLLKCHTHAQASQERRRLEGKGCSIQLSSIIPKIKEVDDLMATDIGLKSRVREGHPEVTFAVMNGGGAIPVSKHKSEGRKIRLELLQLWFGDQPRAAVDTNSKEACEDIIDAYAMLWTARRIFNHDPELREFPSGEAAVDSMIGVPMKISA